MVPRSANLENVKLINGGLSITGVAGPIKASSVNGSIRADKLEGQADLSTVNGRLEAGFDRVSRSNPINLSSVNGPIKLSIPSNSEAVVDAKNLSGGIESEFGRPWRGSDGHRLKALLNHGGAQIHLHNVNGGIEMHDIAGSGHASTVNGGVKAGFRENPKQASDFKTVNGNVELTFVHGLAADFRLKTFNGSVFSDFEMTSLPSRPVSGEQRNGKFVFHSDRFTGGRVGNGGPDLKAENLNGDIRILEGHE